jgi:hypothetical protein
MLQWLKLFQTLGPIVGPKLQVVIPLIVDLVNSIVSNMGGNVRTAKPSDGEFAACVDECKKHGLNDTESKQLCSQLPVA